jgi:hypothetical protein
MSSFALTERMEEWSFATRISEQDYLDAYRLMIVSTFSKIMIVLTYVLFAVCGIEIIISFIGMKINPQDLIATHNFSTTLFNLLPCELVLFVLILNFNFYVPFRLRKKYRKDVNRRGETVQILSPEGISEESPAGSSLSHPWSVCGHWRESQGVFVLVLQSGIYFTYPKACLAQAQQDELRSILTAHLPKK